MKKLLLTLTIATLLSAFFVPLTQAKEYTYFRFSSADGFPSMVNSVFVEKNGFAWIGATDGLYQLTSSSSFIHLTKENASDYNQFLPGNNVLNIYGDSHNVIWVMTDGGFVGYKSSLHFPENEYIVGMDGQKVAYCACEIGDCVYFGGDNCIWKYDYSTESFSSVLSVNSTPSFQVKDLLHGAGNGGSDLLVFKNGGGHFIYDTRNKFVRETVFQNSDDFYESYVDSNGNLWQGIFNDGYYCINPDGQVMCHITKEWGLTSETIMCFQEVGDEMWIGTEGGGINIFNFKTMEISALEHNQHFKGSLPTATVTSMFADHNGRVWCCSPSIGVFVVSETHIKNYGSELITWSPSFEGFSALFQDGAQDDIWIGTTGAGIYRFDPRTERFQSIRSTEGLSVTSIGRFDDNRIAFTASNNGGYILDKRTGSIQKANTKQELFFSNTTYYGSYIDTDSQGRVLTFSSEIVRYDASTGLTEFIDLSSLDISSTLRPVQGAKCKYVEDGRCLYEWDENLPEKLKPIYRSETANSLRGGSMDRNGIIWFTSNDGFWSFNTENHKVDSFLQKFRNKPSSILCDAYGNVWFTTPDQIFSYSPNDGKVVTLSEIDGVRRDDFNSNAKLAAEDGNVYFAAQRSLLRITPDFTFKNEVNPQISVVSVSVDNKVVPDFQKFKVPTNNSSVEIKFFVNSNDILSARMYRIHVDGPVGQIYEAESISPIITLRHLAPGLHNILVSFTKSDGSWTDPQLLYELAVRRPFYASPWFLVLVGFFLFTFIFLIRKVVHARRDEIKAMEEERYNFLVDINHELRTPLTLVNGHLKRLKNDSDLDAKTQKSIDKILLQTNKMSSLLNTILTTSKIKDGRSSLDITSVDFNNWLREIAEEFYDEAMSHNMKIVLRLDPTIGMMPMDEKLMRIATYNLITNAIKHNLSGHHITIWSGWDSNNPNMIRVGVKDHGSGIGVIDTDKLFDSFYKVTEEETSFGLGLAYSKYLIEAHKGNIGAFNNEGDQGATFWYEIPAGYDTLRSEEKILNAVRNRARQIENKTIKDKVILFVDDDADLRIFIYEELKRFCQNVLLASGADEAMDILHDNEVDAVITDIVMPGKDGFDLCREIKSTPQYFHIPVILLTSREDETNRSKGFVSKADYFLPKPFEIDSLLAILDFKFNSVKRKELADEMTNLEI